MKIHFCAMTQNELSDLAPNIERLLLHVDTVNIVDGGSTDGTIVYMRNWSQEEPKIRFFLHPWQDNFPAQRNNYIKRVAEIAQPGDWFVACDPDEILDEEAAAALRGLAELATRAGRNMVGFRCRSVSLKGNKRTWVSEDNYWKRFLIKWDPNFRYTASGTGLVHEGYAGVQHLIMDTGLGPQCPQTYWYEHRKQQNVIWSHGHRNCWIGGGGPNGQHAHIHEWQELRNICSSIGLNDWHSYYQYLLKGCIDQRIKDWMIQHRLDQFGDGASEFREAYKTYFILLHPEEMPTELHGEHIP